MKTSRATSSFLPSGLSPSAPDYGFRQSIRSSHLHRLHPRVYPRVRGLPREHRLRGFTAGAGISPAPESYCKRSYHTATAWTRKLLRAVFSLSGGPPAGFYDLSHLACGIASINSRAGNQDLRSGPRVHAHNEHVVQVRQNPFEDLQRGSWVQSTASLASGSLDRRQGTVQVRRDLRLHRDTRHASLDESRY